MAKQIFSQMEDVSNELLQLLSSFDQKQFNTVPFEGSWTAGQIAEHLLKSDTRLIKTMHGSAKQTVRKPDALVESINAVFLDFYTKLSSPDFIIPSDGVHEKEVMISALKALVNK